MARQCHAIALPSIQFLPAWTRNALRRRRAYQRSGLQPDGDTAAKWRHFSVGHELTGLGLGGR